MAPGTQADPLTAPKPRARRQDARRNREAIVRATIHTLRESPDASIAQIAAAAGVGRVTLYGHFASRAALLEAALIDVLERGNTVLDRLDLNGDPMQAIDRLVTSSWSLLEDSRTLLAAAQQEIPPDRIRDLHATVEERVQRLIVRGRREGAFRDDVPVVWLTAVMHALMQAAATETNAERIEADEVARLLSTSLRAAFATPQAPTP